MSDEEEVYSEEEEEEEVVETKTTTTTTTKVEESGDPEFIKKTDQKRSDLDEQLREYITEWRKQRAKEEEELKRLKEKQAKRKVTRAEEEKKLAERKKQEEERRQRELEEKKQKEIEEKRLRLEEAEKKRQALQALNAASKKTPHYSVSKKDAAANLSPAQVERNKTKEQLEEEKKISLSIRIKPLNIDGLSVDKLREKAQELWVLIVKLETEKYDLEERQKRQDYDLKELKERQKQQLRHKALKKGLDPEALTGKYPPKIQVASKYERRVDIRSYVDKKKLFEGGMDLLEKACAGQNGTACYYLSGLYIAGAKNGQPIGDRSAKELDIPRNMKKAFRYALEGCNLGNMYSCANLSQMYAKGEGTEKNTDLANKYKSRAVELQKETNNTQQTLKFGVGLD